MTAVFEFPSRLMMILVLCLLATLNFGLAQDAESNAASVSDCPQAQRSRLQDQAQFAQFLIRSYRTVSGGGCVQVSKNTTLTFSRQTQGKFLIGNGFQEPAASPAYAIQVGSDITALGMPNVILSEWTGGAHYCLIFQVLELGERVREVAGIDVEEAVDSSSADLDHEGVLLKANDMMPEVVDLLQLHIHEARNGMTQRQDRSRQRPSERKRAVANLHRPESRNTATTRPMRNNAVTASK